MKNKRVSLADIAASLNMSKSTVSFVLNGKAKQFNISLQTQELVQAKAKELNYIPNYFAKSLREGKTKTIGLVLADISNAFYAELSKYTQELLYAKGYTLFIVSTNDEPEIEQQLVRDLAQRSVDAIIVAPCCNEAAVERMIQENNVPLIFVDRFGTATNDFIGIDNEMEAGKLLNRFSVQPRKVGILQPEKSDVRTIQLRTAGLVDACQKRQVSYEIVRLSEKQSIATNQMSELIQNGVDSIVPLNNKVALSTLAHIKRLNIPIPGHVRMISFDDTEAFTYFSPAITALQQPIQGLAKETVQRVLARLQDTNLEAREILLKCAFVARGSH